MTRAVRSLVFASILVACSGNTPEVTQSLTPRAFSSEDGALVAHNASRDLHATIREGAITVASGSHQLTLHADAIGCASVSSEIRSTRADGERTELTREGGVTEWYVDREDGIEQGFTFATRPACPAGELTIDVHASSALHASLASGRVTFADASGLAQLVYGELDVRDADHTAIPAHFALVGDAIRIVVDDHAARYPLVVDPLITNQQARLNATGGAANDQLGFAIAVSGDTIVAGAPQYGSDAGAAYVFVRSGTTWTQQARLEVAGTSGFGLAVGISGDAIIVGAPNSASFVGAAYVFRRTGTTWALEATLPPGSETVFGSGVAISGDIAIVGAPGQFGDYGQAYVYTRASLGTWSQTDTINPVTNTSPGMKFGTSVAFDGTSVVVGAVQANVGGSISGVAYAFGLSCFGNWTEESQLVAPDGSVRSNVGAAVAVSNGTALVGAPDHPYLTGAAGAVYVFVRGVSGGLCMSPTWSLQQHLLASDTASGGHYGSGVSIIGDRALVGAYGASSNAGAGYYLTRTGTTWTEITELVATDSGMNADGVSAALGATYSVLGASNGPSATVPNAGALYVFDTSHAPNGGTCLLATDCASGFCVDGFCCNSACGGGSLTDCQACSVAAGAAADGTCHSSASGTSCNDGSLCTSGDTCNATGTCAGSAAACTPVDQCHAAMCDPTTGVCSQSMVANGTMCTDGNGCTQADTCQAGVCTSGPAVVCAPLDQCHVAGTCSPATGMCTTPSVVDGTACDDGNACTQTDACTSGACTGSSPVICAAADQCHVAGTCDPTTGMCGNPAAANGTSCSDGDLCTTTDQCMTGVCGGTMVSCAASACESAGVCSATTGMCSGSVALPDGTACPGGVCMTGDCVFPDGGAMPDAGSVSASDAGVDAGAEDSGIDGSVGDAAVDHDAASMIDANVAHDAGRDSGARDGATLDAQPDSAVTPPVNNPSCGCTVPSSSRSGGGWLALTLAFVIARRRRR